MRFLLAVFLIPLALSAGERPASAPPIDERLTGIESRVNGHDAELVELRNKIDALQLAIKCPCGRGGKCICPPDSCLCPNCPEHHGKKVTETADSKAKWKGNQPTGKGRELLFFTASWCANCPAAIDRLEDYKSQIYYIDCSEDTPYFSAENALAKKYGVTGFPYLIATDDGEVSERTSGDSVGSYFAEKWLNPVASRPAATVRKVIVTRPAPAKVYSAPVVRYSAPPRQSLSLSRIPGPSWNNPGDLRSHLINQHGYSPSVINGLSYGQLNILKDNDHNSWGHGGHPYAGRSRSVPYASRSYARSYSPPVYFSSGYSSGGCPGGMCPR